MNDLKETRRTNVDYENEDYSREVFFTIKGEYNNKSEEIDFRTEYEEDGGVRDGYSFNPCTGWTQWDNFHQGWIEQDDTQNWILSAISEFSCDPVWDEWIYDFSLDAKDIGATETYDFEFEGEIFKMTVTITDIDFEV